MTLQLVHDANFAAWKADREAMKRDALASLSIEDRAFDELFLIYEAAGAAFKAWAPPEIDGADALNTPWTRESERAFIVMEAVAAHLAEIWPDSLAERHNLFAVLADWYSHCDDNPKIVTALVKLLADCKHFRA